jgi:hypothetical protein
MTQTTYRRHPVALAIALLFAVGAQAQDFSLNSLTLDTQTGQTVGSVSRQGDIKHFFEIQKEVVFNILGQLGLERDKLPPSVLRKLDKPQTTNVDAFTLFSRALDLADRGLYAQAGQLFQAASKVDPEFALARGMARLMPAFDVPSGGDRQVLQHLKKAARDEGEKTSRELNDSLNKKDKEIDDKAKHGGNGKKSGDKLALLGQGEGNGNAGGSGGTQDQLDVLGLSDEGGNGEGGLANGGGSTSNSEALASDLGGNPPSSSSAPTPVIGAGSGSVVPPIADANKDQQRQDIIDEQKNNSAPPPPPPPPPIYTGDFFGYVGGSFVDGSSSFTTVDSQNVVVIKRTGLADEDPSDKVLWGTIYSSYTARKLDPVAYSVLLEGEGGTAIAYGGTPTPATALPSIGQTTYLGLLLNSSDTSQSNWLTQVDWQTGKVFAPVSLGDGGANSGGPLMIGSVNRATSGLNLKAWVKPETTGTPTRYTISDTSTLDFFGNTPVLAGGQFQYTDYTSARTAMVPKGNGGLILTDPVSNGTPTYTPANGEIWSGFGTGIRYNTNPNALSFLADSVTTEFTLNPGVGSVTGTIAKSGTFSFGSSATDPNAYINAHAFGAEQNVGFGGAPNANGVPAFFSTQGDFSGSGWDHNYHSIGYWSWDYVGVFGGDITYMPYSTWVAGQLTNVAQLNNLTGLADYSGKVLGSTWNGHLLAGDFAMTVDFGARSLSGALNNLRTNDGQIWQNTIDFSLVSFTGNTFSTTIVSGSGVLSGSLQGAFYGPDAIESGGAWSVSLGDTDEQKAAGVYTSSRGDTYTLPMDRSGGVLGGAYSGNGNAFSANGPLAAQGSYSLDADHAHLTLFGSFDAIGVTGNFGSISSATGWQPVSNASYQQWALNSNDYAAYNSLSDQQTYNFNNAGSLAQKSADDSFYRFFLTNDGGQRVEGYFGTLPTALPTTGISSFDFAQSATRLNAANPLLSKVYTDSQSGLNGDFPGKLYINWSTGQVFGYNATPGIDSNGGGIGIYIGHVDSAGNSIDGAYLVRSYRATASDESPVSRWMYNGSSANLTLFGPNGSGVSGVGGVFGVNWQDESLSTPPANASGNALISGLANGAQTVNVAPAANEVWNGFVVGFLTDRSSGEQVIQGNSNVSGVSMTLNKVGGHVDGAIATDTNLMTGGAADGNTSLSISGGANPADAQGSYSAYVSPKAFGIVQEAATIGGVSTPNFIAATPEMNGKAESDRYDYTTWGVWGADFNADKNLTAAPNSLWVAGKLTQTVDMPASGSAGYTGQVIGEVTGSQSGQVQGTLNMAVDFGNRTVGGSMNNLTIISGTPYNQASPGVPAPNGAVWVNQANLSGGWNAGSVQYNAAIRGAGISSGSATGAFFGPQAIETGGRWNIQTETSQGAGIFTGKRGAISGGGGGGSVAP